MTRTFRYLCAFLLSAALIWPLAAAASKPPEKIARDTVQTLIDEIEGRRGELRDNPDRLDALIRRVLVPLVDIDHMSRLILGRHWDNASDVQRKRFQKAFTQMLIQTYGDALLGFRQEQIDFQPMQAGAGAEDVVFNAVVHTESGGDILVSFNLHLVDGEWRIYNGSVGSLSFVTNYRAQFNQEIRRGSLESLIGKLESRYGGAG